MKIRLTEPHFFAPDYYKAEEVINYEGPWTPGMEPLDEEAEAAQKAYFEKNPHASLHPAGQLPLRADEKEPVIPVKVTPIKAEPEAAKGKVVVVKGAN